MPWRKGHIRVNRKTGKVSFVKPHYARSSRKCWIATACYESESVEVRVLRHWRDGSLTRSVLGVALVSLYYYVSPPVAHVAGASSVVTRVLRTLLQPLLLIAQESTGT